MPRMLAALLFSALVAAWLAPVLGLAQNAANGAALSANQSRGDEIRVLKEELSSQQEQIKQLRAALDEQRRLLERLLESRAAGPAQASGPGTVPAAARAVVAEAVASPAGAVPQYAGPKAPAEKKSDVNIAGIKFSGDFRYRLDAQLRSSNAIAGPLQNIRSRYRLRLNADRELDPHFRVHAQLSTGPLNNAITNDQDFAGIITKHPFSIAEAYVDFHPAPGFALRGGRMEEVFSDNMRFVWDDDVRFNGFQQIVAVPVRSGFLGLKSVELRAGEYILSNPNVPILSPSSPFASAGFQVGKKVRDTNLFHPGFVVKGNFNPAWSQQFISDIQLYRNPNQIQLASLPSGFPVVANPALGIALAGPLTGAGNATTTPGGAIYSAPHFQVLRVAYRLGHSGWTLGGSEMPAWLDFQAARNVGAGKLRDAFMASANLGNVKGRGDVRFLYQYAVKDANSLISQFTDDDLGTGTGVNIAVHAMRFDLGLTRFLQWQNLLFLQNERRASNPTEQLFVPLQRGARPTFRYLGQLAFSF